MIDRARELAFKAHAGQKYGDGREYTVHLEDVVHLVQEHGCDSTDIAVSAAYLHDLLEDCKGYGYEHLVDACGVEVAQIVLFCTDQPGPNRKTRKRLTYARMREDIDFLVKTHGEIPAGHFIKDAIRVKVADRIANIQACFRGDRPDLWQMYEKEKAAFYWALHEPEVCDSMWAEYDRLLSEPPEALAKHTRSRAMTAQFAKVYGGREVDTLTVGDAVEKMP